MGTPNLKKDINFILPCVINTEDRSKKEIKTLISPTDKTIATGGSRCGT
jgi:hypothetical protein